MGTSSSVLANILQLLSEHQHVQHKIREEVILAYERNGGDLDYDTLTSLPLLDAVTRESLRLCVSLDVSVTLF